MSLSLLGTAASLASGGMQLQHPPPAHAVLVIEDDTAMRVFDEASASVVSIINYKIEGGIQVSEGVGTGVIWDKYNHVGQNTQACEPDP
jgi:hypothetical protein